MEILQNHTNMVKVSRFQWASTVLCFHLGLCSYPKRLCPEFGPVRAHVLRSGGGVDEENRPGSKSGLITGLFPNRFWIKTDHKCAKALLFICFPYTIHTLFVRLLYFRAHNLQINRETSYICGKLK